jgi:hypothetical protein
MPQQGDRGTVQIVKRTTSELEAALPHQREVLDEAMLDLQDGLTGDTWNRRGSSRTPDGSPHPGMQLTVMNTRVIELVAGSREHWPLAGDQLYVDMDLSAANLPPGTQLSIGAAVVEVSPLPHTGCGKFVSRFGIDAMKFVNSPVGRELNLRGINAFVLVPGMVRRGDPVHKVGR